MSVISRSGRSSRTSRSASSAVAVCITACPCLRRAEATKWRLLEWASRMSMLAMYLLRHLQTTRPQPIERRRLAAEVTHVHSLMLRQKREVLVRVVQLVVVRDQGDLALRVAVEDRELRKKPRPVHREQRARGMHRDEGAAAPAPLHGLGDGTEELPRL